jgi:hypothetical protein
MGLFLLAVVNPNGVLRAQDGFIAVFSAVAFAMLYTYATVLLGLRPPTESEKGHLI